MVSCPTLWVCHNFKRCYWNGIQTLLIHSLHFLSFSSHYQWLQWPTGYAAVRRGRAVMAQLGISSFLHTCRNPGPVFRSLFEFVPYSFCWVELENINKIWQKTFLRDHALCSAILCHTPFSCCFFNYFFFYPARRVLRGTLFLFVLLLLL